MSGAAARSGKEGPEPGWAELWVWGWGPLGAVGHSSPNLSLSERVHPMSDRPAEIALNWSPNSQTLDAAGQDPGWPKLGAGDPKSHLDPQGGGVSLFVSFCLGLPVSASVSLWFLSLTLKLPTPLHRGCCSLHRHLLSTSCVWDPCNV